MKTIHTLLSLLSVALVLLSCGPAPQQCPQEPDAIKAQAQSVEDTQQLPTPEKMVVLLDYSGSMCPGWRTDMSKVVPIADCEKCNEKRGKRCLNSFYYGLPDFSNYLAQWLDAATPNENMQVEFLLFNKKLWHFDPNSGQALAVEGSPKLKFDKYDLGGADKNTIEQWVDAIPDNPCSSSFGRACGQTFMKQALEKTLDSIEEDTMVWLITDNILDRSSSKSGSEEAKRNKEFYDFINSDDRIVAIAAYPMSSQESCHFMCGTSLFTYGFYISKSKDALTIARNISGSTSEKEEPQPGLIWNPALRDAAKEGACEASKTKGVPVRLKPVDDDVLSVLVSSPACQKKELDDPSVDCNLTVRVKNNLHHQIVDKATIHMHNGQLESLINRDGKSEPIPWIEDICAEQMKVLQWEDPEGNQRKGTDPLVLKTIGPREYQDVKMRIRLPNPNPKPQSIGELWDVSITESIFRRGEFVAEVTDIETSLAVNADEMECIYGSKDLPDIFKTGKQSKKAYAKTNIMIKTENNGKLLAFLSFVAMSIGGLVFLIGTMRFQRKYYTLVVNGVQRDRFTLFRLDRKQFAIEGSKMSLQASRGWSRFRVSAINGYKLKDYGARGYELLTSDGSKRFSVQIKRGWK